MYVVQGMIKYSKDTLVEYKQLNEFRLIHLRRHTKEKLFVLPKQIRCKHVY